MVPTNSYISVHNFVDVVKTKVYNYVVTTSNGEYCNA